MVRLRLTRGGRHKRPFYRIVAADSRMPRDGRYLEVLGTYDPLQTPAVVTLKQERVRAWLKLGAQPSDTVHHLLKKSGLIQPAVGTAGGGGGSPAAGAKGGGSR